MRTEAAAALVAFLLGAYSASHAADAPEAFVYRSAPNEDSEFKIALAKSAAPLWYIFDEAAPLATLLEQECGTLPEAARVWFEQRTRELNAADSLDEVVDPGIAAAIPYCNRVDIDVPFLVGAGDTAEGLLRTYTGFWGPQAQRALAEHNIRKGNWAAGVDVSNLAETLEAGKIIDFPYVSTQRVFVPVSKDFEGGDFFESHEVVGFTAERLLSVGRPVNVVATVVPGNLLSGRVLAPDYQRARVASPALAVQTEPLELVSATNDWPSCSSPQAWPYLDVSEFSKRVKAEAAHLTTQGRTIRSGVVGIVDSGLGTVGQGMFQERYFRRSTEEDDPDNEYQNDTWGINLEFRDERQGDIFPILNTDPMKTAHGTQVASLVLGGREYLATEDTTTDALVKLVIVNFGSYTTGLQPVEKLLEALIYLDRRDADVVNLSLTMNSPPKSVIRRMQAALAENQVSALYVVAAGNTLTGGVDLIAHPRYPASLGNNPVYPHLLTVGALNHDSELAGFSNHGPPVDIYAPGCSLAAVDHQDMDTTVSGTSMSAAHVSFVAATIKALGGGGLSAAEVKNRLVDTADQKGQLGKELTQVSGSILNPVKAISISHDLIEGIAPWSDGDLYRYGRFVNLAALTDYCAEDVTRASLTNVRRVNPNIVRDHKTYIRYLIRPDGSEYKECIQRNNEIPLPAFMENGETVNDILITSVKDIVIAVLP